MAHKYLRPKTKKEIKEALSAAPSDLLMRVYCRCASFDGSMWEKMLLQEIKKRYESMPEVAYTPMLLHSYTNNPE